MLSSCVVSPQPFFPPTFFPPSQFIPPTPQDMADLLELNEASVLENLKTRYTSDLIYVSLCAFPVLGVSCFLIHVITQSHFFPPFICRRTRACSVWWSTRTRKSPSTQMRLSKCTAASSAALCLRTCLPLPTRPTAPCCKVCLFTADFTHCLCLDPLPST